ncbi:MAG TPA: endopeptidase La [Gemmatimonadaceae bacterium]|nr:endopeptidase La [Gemmatimonadaceae bacterium]
MPLYILRDDEAYELPERLPVLPLRDVVVFPHMVVPLLVGRAASLAAVESAVNDGNWIFLVAQRSVEVPDPAAADLFRVGVVGRILRVSRMQNGTTKVLVEGIGRARVTRYAPRDAHLRATLADAPYAAADATDADLAANAHRVVSLFEEYVGLHRRLPQEVVSLVQSTDSRERQACGIAAHLQVRLEQRQELLEIESLGALLSRLAELLASEIEILRLERKIESDVRGSLFQNQREFYLQEQLKAIHRELGQEEGDGFEELEAAIAAKRFPDPVRERAIRELRKLRRIPALSPESSVVRSYLDWLVALPWSERTDEVLDVARAAAVLNEDHYGLEEVKDRILDYLAVLALVGRLEGPILCLVGPPGVGKTSLGRSIARALSRRFVRMSLGGVRDEAEIRGHRRTYIGSMPGRVIQAMRRAEVVNPVILLDEVDKMGQDWRGDPASALLEVLDPEQNRTFSDHYLEIDYDLSQVLFVTTANSLLQIPEPLRDRMEIIRLPGYVDHEKHAIARHFLVPKQLRLHGIEPGSVTWEPEVLPAIARRYTREAGVRDLERRLARIARKLARRAAAAPASPPAPVTVAVSDLEPLLGVAPFDWEDSSLDDKVGVATGLAYTQIGGDLLEIEVASVRGRGKLQLTGTLGDVLKESANAAITYARARAKRLGIDREFYRSRDVHIHIPSGATPKDGPSAGIAIAVAVVSALSGVPVRGHVAMTGEITLRGRVLPIGGLKEKSVAALRAGISDIIIPAGNAREVQELAEDIRSRLTFHPVSTMDEVLALALRVDQVPTQAGVELTH